jgi:hypothetical protein
MPQLERLRFRYAQQIVRLDEEMSSFVDVLDERMRGGDLALAVLSDHGFYLGEFGLLGKPKDAPLLPPLFELIGHLSPHFDGLVTYSSLLQPHQLTSVIAELLGVKWQIDAAGGRTRIAGRHSDAVQTLTLIDEDSIGIAFRDSLATARVCARRAELQTDRAWRQQFGQCGHRHDIPAELLDTPWLAGFKSLLPE